MKIGLVDLDTSHPATWLPILRENAHRIVGVYDSGAVYPAGYAEQFAQDKSIEQVFSSLEQMAEAVDLAIIHSCNWDAHLEKALPFVEAGKALLIDKPMAGNVRDCAQLLEWERQGIRLTGGSSLRYCLEVEEWKNNHNDSHRDKRRDSHRPDNDIVFAVAGCSVDEFNYGIHAYALLHGIMGAGIDSVRYLGKREQKQFELNWTDGRSGLINVGATSGHLPFYATIVTGSDVAHIQVDHKRLYATMLPRILPYLAGEAAAPVPLKEIIEVELAAIAAKKSELAGGQKVYLQELTIDDKGYDGALFALEYKRQKTITK
jgi:hypothetical protein